MFVVSPYLRASLDLSVPFTAAIRELRALIGFCHEFRLSLDSTRYFGDIRAKAGCDLGVFVYRALNCFLFVFFLLVSTVYVIHIKIVLISAGVAVLCAVFHQPGRIRFCGVSEAELSLLSSFNIIK